MMTPPIQPYKNGLRYFRLRRYHGFFDPTNTWHRLQKTRSWHRCQTSRWLHHSHHAFKKHFPITACKGEIWPFRQPLISTPQLCQNNFRVTFDKEKATIYSQTGKPVLTGKFCPIKNLFLLPIGPSPSHKIPSQKLQQSANNVQILTLDSKQNLAIWYHRICFSPVVTTWIKAINAGFSPPGLASPASSSQTTCPPQSILTWATSNNNPKTTGQLNKLRLLSSHPSPIKKPKMHLYFSIPPTQYFQTKQALSPSFPAEDIAT